LQPSLGKPLSALLLLLLPVACRAPQAWQEDADEEAYAILSERRAELGASDAFTIEAPPDPLRARLLRGEEGPIKLDLVGCLQVAAENSRDWQDQREALFRAALDLTLERWNYSVQENGSLAAFVNGTGTSADSQGFLSNLNLFKLLGIGTSIVADAGIDLLKDVGSGNAWDAVSHLSLNITQPILRGFGRDIVLEPLTQAERDVLYQARAYERFRHTFAVDIANRYFNVLEQVDRLANEEANYQNLKRLRERNEALAEAGRQTDIQVDQTREQEFGAENRLVSARRDLESSLDDLKFVLGLPIETEFELDEAGMRSLERWAPLTRDLDEQGVVRIGLENRLDLMTVRDRVEDARRGVKVAADALRMGLDVSLGASVDSVTGEPLNFNSDDVSWRAGLSIDLPIDKIPERNAYRRAVIGAEAARRNEEEASDGVTADLRDSLRRLEAARASLEIQLQSQTLNGRRVESAALNLEAGRASTRDVLEAQEDLLTAQNAVAAALTDIILAGLALYRDMERLEITEQGLALLEDPETGEARP